MTVTFGRIGRVFLAVATVLAVATLACVVVLDGAARSSVTSVLGGVGLLVAAQGVVWTAVQRRMFGSIAALRRSAVSEPLRRATILAVNGTSSQIGAEAIARLDLLIDGRAVRRYVRIPFHRAATVRPGMELPVRTDPNGTRALIVEWERLP